MTKLQPLFYTLVISSTMLLSACGSINHQQTQTDNNLVIIKNELPVHSQDEFENLLNSLNGNSNTSVIASGGKIIAKNAYSPQNVLHNIEIKSRLLQQYSQWKGVRYHLGGNSQRGIDCSAFVQRTFLEQFSVELPRSTHQQQTVGKRIARDKLRTGDLVLFHSGPTGRHIGIYVGDNKFVHASTKKGVIISSMDNVYWKTRFKEARRVLTRS